MLAYLLRRIAIIVPTLFFVSIIIFGLQQLLPGDPALAMAGEERDPQVIAFLRAKYRLDESLPMRYGIWIGGVLRGDLGESIRIKQPVLDLVLEKLPVRSRLGSIAPTAACFADCCASSVLRAWVTEIFFSRARSIEPWSVRVFAACPKALWATRSIKRAPMAGTRNRFIGELLRIGGNA